MTSAGLRDCNLVRAFWAIVFMRSRSSGTPMSARSSLTVEMLTPRREAKSLSVIIGLDARMSESIFWRNNLSGLVFSTWY